MRKAAEQGHLEAQYFLGGMYEYKDPDGLKWYLKAAEQGHSESQYMLGLAYDVDDRPQAIRWYRAAAEKGHAGAQFELGLAYEHGLGVPKSDKLAIYWYTKAAEQGDGAAQDRLKRYETGPSAPYWIIAISLALLIYVAPRLVAHRRKHHYIVPILIVNFFLGWTLVGWVFALAWASMPQRQETAA